MQGRDEHFVWNLRHAHPFKTLRKPFVMLERPEDVNAAVCAPERLHSFKDGLPVVQSQDCRRHSQFAVRHNDWFGPFASSPIRYDHVVRDIFSKLEIIEVSLT